MIRALFTPPQREPQPDSGWCRTLDAANAIGAMLVLLTAGPMLALVASAVAQRLDRTSVDFALCLFTVAAIVAFRSEWQNRFGSNWRATNRRKLLVEGSFYMGAEAISGLCGVAFALKSRIPFALPVTATYCAVCYVLTFVVLIRVVFLAIWPEKRVEVPSVNH